MKQDRSDEVGEERVGIEGFGFEFGVELNAQHPRVAGHFRDFAELAVLEGAGKEHPFFFKRLFVLVVKLVAMAMALPDEFFSISGFGKRAWF